jgi:hypothetical protein
MQLKNIVSSDQIGVKNKAENRKTHPQKKKRVLNNLPASDRCFGIKKSKFVAYKYLDYVLQN